MEIFFIQAYNSSQKGEVLTDVRQSDEKKAPPPVSTAEGLYLILLLMVPAPGIEPGTYGLQNRCSTN
jgi:hypothetical protein